MICRLLKRTSEELRKLLAQKRPARNAFGLCRLLLFFLLFARLRFRPFYKSEVGELGRSRARRIRITLGILRQKRKRFFELKRLNSSFPRRLILLRFLLRSRANQRLRIDAAAALAGFSGRRFPHGLRFYL